MSQALLCSGKLNPARTCILNGSQECVKHDAAHTLFSLLLLFCLPMLLLPRVWGASFLVLAGGSHGVPGKHSLWKTFGVPAAHTQPDLSSAEMQLCVKLFKALSHHCFWLKSACNACVLNVWIMPRISPGNQVQLCFVSAEIILNSSMYKYFPFVPNVIIGRVTSDFLWRLFQQFHLCRNCTSDLLLTGDRIFAVQMWEQMLLHGKWAKQRTCFVPEISI